MCASGVNLYLRDTIRTQTRGTKLEMKPFVQQKVLLCDIFWCEVTDFRAVTRLENYWVPAHLCAVTVCEWVTPGCHGYDGGWDSLYFWL